MANRRRSRPAGGPASLWPLGCVAFAIVGSALLLGLSLVLAALAAVLFHATHPAFLHSLLGSH